MEKRLTILNQHALSAAVLIHWRQKLPLLSWEPCMSLVMATLGHMHGPSLKFTWAFPFCLPSCSGQHSSILIQPYSAIVNSPHLHPQLCNIAYVQALSSN